MSLPEPPPSSLQRLRRAQRLLAARPREELCAALEKTAESWLEPDSRWLARAEPVVAAEGAFSPAMVRHALPAMIAPLRGADLRTLAAQAEAAAPDARPRLTLQILPSNVPGLAAVASGLALLCRNATLLKAGRRDRGFTDLWVESLAAVDPQLADNVAVAYWPVEDRVHADPALAAADLVIATGGDDAVAALRARARGRFAAYGSRLSVAFVAAECIGTADALRDAARGVAYDVALWDQRGCLSPRLCFVEGDRAHARAAAAAIADALLHLHGSLPPGPMTTEDILAVRRFRDAAEWSTATSAGDFFFAADLGGGSVVVDTGESPQPAPTHRCLRVVPVASCRSMLEILAPWRRSLEGIGVAARRRYEPLAKDLEAFAFPRVAAAGALQRPSLLWRHGGRSRIAPWTEPL